MQVSSKLPRVGTTIFSVMSALAQEHVAINLSQGFPNFLSSEKLTDLVCHYLKAGYNQYAPMPGLPALREQIARKVQIMYGLEVDPAQEVTVTAGATQAIYCAIAAFVHPGDEVIILEPAYDCYRPAVEVNGGKPVVYEMQPPDYKVDWRAVQALVTPATRMIVINTPHNPTGSILQANDMLALQQLTAGTDILVLRDCRIITYPFRLVLLHANCVKKPHRSPTMVTFFALLAHKITSSILSNLFLCNP